MHPSAGQRARIERAADVRARARQHRERARHVGVLRVHVVYNRRYLPKGVDISVTAKLMTGRSRRH